MSRTLDDILDAYVRTKIPEWYKTANSKKNAEAAKDKDKFILSIKKQIKQDICDEIKSEVKEEAIQEAEKTINQRASLKRIEELRKLIFNGFWLAIAVGLFVNQATDFIGFFKGSVTLASIYPTLILALLFLVYPLHFWHGTL